MASGPRTSRLDRWFAPFEGARNPYPIAIFRIAFFAALALHFFPALLIADDGISIRTAEWSTWLHLRFSDIPPGARTAMKFFTVCACAMGIVGLLPRIAAIVAGLGFYAFASFNGMYVQTLALVEAWGLLLLWAICGGGANVLSVQARLWPRPPPRSEPRLLSSLILFQILLAVFFSGVEKLLAGWPIDDQMGILLSYPKGFMLRDWVTEVAWMRSDAITTSLTWLTVIVELGAPIAILLKRTRIPALIVYEGFFLGIIVMLQVPPLFYFMFAFGALLALDDQEVSAIGAWLRRRFTGR